MSMPSVNRDNIQLKGGWDQITPPLSLPPGVLKDALNFECSLTGGYTRISGYERFDGHPAPSSATYSVLFVNAFANIPVVGNTITGVTSGATGVVLYIATDHLVLKNQSLSYTTGETIKVGGTTIAAVAAAQVLPAVTKAIYKNIAAADRRTAISAVPGSGSIIGTFLYGDVVYAFRPNAGGTAVDIYKSSSGGWTAVPLFYTISFTAGGTATPADGATLTQGGVTALVKRVVLESGAWTGTGAGRLIIAAPSGGNFAAGAATLTGGATVTLTAIQTAITIAVGGKLETVQWNFAGGASTTRIYGCDGVNKAFEFDGTTYVPLGSGAPKHIAAHKNLLFLMISSSVIYSAPGLPYDFTAISGAGEIAIGAVGTGMMSLQGAQTTGTLLITTRENTYMLYGVDDSTFNFVLQNSGSGAIDYTHQNMANAYVLDDKGVISLQASLNFGNFDVNTITFQIKNFIADKRGLSPLSVLDRNKSQYRLYFNDGSGLYITIVNGTVIGCMPTYFPHIFNHVMENKYANGEEASFAGATNGYVYQLDKGTSFDGQAIEAYMGLVYNHSNSPRMRKNYKKSAIDITGDAFYEISFGYYLDWQNSQVSQSASVAYSGTNVLQKWDNFTWDDFTWDESDITPRECEMVGTAENVAITIRSGTAYIAPFTVNSIILHYIMRRAMR